MATQDQQQEKKKRRKRERQGPALLGVQPRQVYRGHLVWLNIAGKNFNKNIWRSISITEGSVVDQRFESDGLIALQVRVNPGEHNGVLSVSMSAEVEDDTENLPIPAAVSSELAENEVRILASPIEGTAIVQAGEKSDAKPRLALGTAEISNRQYLEFLNYLAITGDHSACHPDEAPDKSHVPDHWDDSALRAPDNPVTGLDWFDAYAYAAWKGFRLPTKEEWERAAGDAVYPWGDDPLTGNANTKETATMLVPSGSHRTGISPNGLAHMAGNAGEWVDSAGKVEGTALIKGGSFRTGMLDARTSESGWADKRERRIDIGFRIAVDLTDEIWAAKEEAEEEWLAQMQGISIETVPAADAESKQGQEVKAGTPEESGEKKKTDPESGEQQKKRGEKKRNKKKKKK